MSATVRSVDVRLNAMVSTYIADMRRAGRETDRAFARSQGAIQATNRELGVTKSRLDAVDTSGRAVSTTLGRNNTRLRVMGEQAHRVNTELDGLRSRNAALNGNGRESLVVVGRNTGRMGSQIDTMSGRLGLFIRLGAALGPALVPIGAVGVPAIAALTAGLGAAAGALGVTLLAVHGLGDAMKALDAYQLEPTTANLQKLREEMDKAGPTAAHFVRYLDSIEPQLESLQEAARAGLLPGWEAGIDAMLRRLPQVRRIISDLAREMGLLSTQAGQELAGPRFRAFFDYLETDAAPTLRAFSKATGNVVLGIGNMLVGFAPLTRVFTGGMVEMTRSFADWSAGLGDNAGFQGFVDYLRSTGPQVLDFLGQFTLALAAIIEAGAPVGAVMIPMLTALLKVIETIASSDLGTPLLAGVAAMSALQLATAAWGKIAQTTAATFVATQARATTAILTTTSAQDRARLSVAQLAAAERQRTLTAIGGAGRLGAVLAGVAVASTGAGDSLGITNTASLALMGSFAGPWGAAIGGAAGLTLDLAAANNSLEEAIRGADDAIASMDVEVMRAQLEALNTELAALEESTSIDNSWNPFKASKETLDAVISGTNELATGTGAAAEAKRDDLEAAIAAADANTRYARSAQLAGRISGYTASEIRGMTAAMEEQRSEALAAFDAVTRYAQALVDARKQAEKSEAGIRLSGDLTRKQRLEIIANRDALSGLASAWNSQGQAVANNVGKYRQARADLIATARQMGATRGEARHLADTMLEIPKRILTDIETRGGQETLDALKRIQRQAEDVAGRYQIEFVITQTNAFNKHAAMDGSGLGGADGMTVPGSRAPYGDKLLIGAAPGEEIISNRHGQADKNRYALKAANRGAKLAVVGYADGGTAGFSSPGSDLRSGRQTLDDRLAIAQIMQQIRDLRRQLAKDGKDHLEGLNRKIAYLQLQAAEKELRLAQTREEREARAAARERDRDRISTIRDLGAGLSFDSLLPSEPQTVAQGVNAEIATFREQLLAAGGEWTRELRLWARDMRINARIYDGIQKALDRELKKRSELVDKLQEQQAQLDQLNSTMESYSKSVAGNFLTNPFGGRREKAPTSPELEAAKQQLAALRASGGDSVAGAAAASRLVDQIKRLEESLRVKAEERTGAQLLRDTLENDTRDALAFSKALDTLAQKGLDTTGQYGGLYAQLATSGDLVTAEELAAMSAEQIEEYEKLFKAREDAAALVGSQATQAVYSEQHAELVALIAQTNGFIAQSDATIAVLEATLAVLGEQVKLGSEAGAELLIPQLQGIRDAINNMPRQQQHQNRKG